MSRQHLCEVVINLTVPTAEPRGHLANKLWRHLCQAAIARSLATSLPLKRLSVPSIWWTQFRPWASRSTSITPAITKTAGSETVRYELVTRRASLRCTADRCLRYFSYRIGKTNVHRASAFTYVLLI